MIVDGRGQLAVNSTAATNAAFSLPVGSIGRGATVVRSTLIRGLWKLMPCGALGKLKKGSQPEVECV